MNPPEADLLSTVFARDLETGTFSDQGDLYVVGYYAYEHSFPQRVPPLFLVQIPTFVLSMYLPMIPVYLPIGNARMVLAFYDRHFQRVTTKVFEIEESKIGSAIKTIELDPWDYADGAAKQVLAIMSRPEEP